MDKIFGKIAYNALMIALGTIVALFSCDPVYAQENDPLKPVPFELAMSSSEFNCEENVCVVKEPRCTFSNMKPYDVMEKYNISTSGGFFEEKLTIGPEKGLFAIVAPFYNEDSTETYVYYVEPFHKNGNPEKGLHRICYLSTEKG